jgi:hypothetical protein
MATVLSSGSHVGGLGGIEGSAKLDAYKLSDFVWECRVQKAMSYFEISKACNNVLKDRNDSQTYYEITMANVRLHCEKLRGRIQKYRGSQLQKKLNKAVTIIPKLQALVNRIDLEMEKLQESGEPVKVGSFASLVKSMNQTITLLAFLKERSKPYISIDAVKRNINSLVSEIEADRDIPEVIKRKFLQLVARFVLTPDLLETGPQPRELSRRMLPAPTLGGSDVVDTTATVLEE